MELYGALDTAVIKGTNARLNHPTWMVEEVVNRREVQSLEFSTAGKFCSRLYIYNV